jgi:UDP-glucose 4-epimerase
VQVLVTGGAGFIGGNLCRRLAANDAIERVVVIDDLSTGFRANLDGLDRLGVELVEGSILDPGALARSAAGVDAIVHLGARGSVARSLVDPAATHEINATGTLRVLEAARAADPRPHVIVASSSSVYGANPELPKHEDLATLPMSPYAASKLATEGYTLAYGHAFGLPVLAFRFFNVFGPLQPAGHDYAAVIPAFMSAAVAGRPLTVHGDGRQSRDFTYVETVCAVIEDALVRRVTTPDPVNLAYGTRTDLLTLIGMIEEIVGHEVAVEHTAPRPGDVRHSRADSTRVRSLFPDIDVVPFEEGLRATYEWIRGRYEAQA